MAIFTATDARIYLAQFSLGAFSRSVELTHKAAALDATTFGNTTKVHLAGLKEINLSFSGYQDYALLAPDAAFDSKFAIVDAPVTLSPDGGEVGETAYFFKALHAEYTPMSATIGEMAPFSASASASSGKLVRGVIAATGSKTSTAAGTSQTLGAVSATQSIYAAMHILSVTGTNPTLDMIVQSDADDNWGAGATTRVTFTQATAAGSQFLSAAGPVTDTYWRVSWTIGGTATPTFNIVVAIGIA
jgi:hypothetical protein